MNVSELKVTDFTAEPDAGELKLAVILPCKDEARIIGKTIARFSESLRSAEIWVCDNSSNDGTGEVAEGAGANVILERHAGKGNAVKRLFAEVDADVYIMADGDNTYDPTKSRAMIDLLVGRQLDMVIGTRIGSDENQYRPLHKIGNRIFSFIFGRLFGHEIDDLLSGYRVFSRRFVKTFPSRSRGFEIETELTARAIANRLPIAQMATPYAQREAGTESKLRSFRDGFRIMLHYLIFYKSKSSLVFFSLLSLACLIFSAILFTPVLTTYIETGLVPRLPTLIGSVVCLVLAFVILTCGLILQATSMAAYDAIRRDYLKYSRRLR